MAGGYSSRSFPATLGTPSRASVLRVAAPALSIVRTEGLPAACAFSICAADSGYFALLTEIVAAAALVGALAIPLTAAPAPGAPAVIAPARRTDSVRAACASFTPKK